MSLEKLRTRWLRWLGQKTRIDKPHWTTLISSNYSGWARRVLSEHNISVEGIPFIHWRSPKSEIKKYFHCVITHANIEELRQLDELYCDDIISKMQH